VEYRISGVKRFICNDLATSRKNLANFGPVTPEFKRGKDVQPFVDQQFGYVRTAAPLLELWGSVLSFGFAGPSVLRFVSFIRLGASLLCRAGYTPGFATHF